MKLFTIFASCIAAFGQHLTPNGGTIRAIDAVKPDVVVFAGDNVIPQFVDGGGWKTTLKFVNLDNYPVTFSVNFISDAGAPLPIPIVGLGVVTAVQVSLVTAGSISFDTAGTAPQLSQGWALIQHPNTTDSVGGFAVFAQSVPGQQTQEAVVPVVNQFSNHFVMMFDNAGYVTAIAIANPTPNSVGIPINVRNPQGVIIGQHTYALGPYQHAAFTTASIWPETAGVQGAIEFLTPGFGVAALGLRFNGLAFTSFDVFENFAWTPGQ